MGIFKRISSKFLYVFLIFIYRVHCCSYYFGKFVLKKFFREIDGIWILGMLWLRGAGKVGVLAGMARQIPLKLEPEKPQRLGRCTMLRKPAQGKRKFGKAWEVYFFCKNYPLWLNFTLTLY